MATSKKRARRHQKMTPGFNDLTEIRRLAGEMEDARERVAELHDEMFLILENDTLNEDVIAERVDELVVRGIDYDLAISVAHAERQTDLVPYGYEWDLPDEVGNFVYSIVHEFEKSNLVMVRLQTPVYYYDMPMPRHIADQLISG